MQPNAPFLTRSRAEAWRATAQPLPVPRQLPPAPKPHRAYLLALAALRVVAVLVVVLSMALYFFLFGEERPERVRPELTPAQRARAFRSPGQP